MNKLVFAFVAVVSTSGCGGKKPAVDCDGAVDNAVKISSNEMKLDGATAAKIKDISLERCKQDQWSGDAVACIAAAKTGGDLGKCEDKQTPEQRDKLKKALEPMAPPDPGSAGPGSASEPGAGSAAGSGAAGAGSGSAGSAAGSAKT